MPPAAPRHRPPVPLRSPPAQRSARPAPAGAGAAGPLFARGAAARPGPVPHVPRGRPPPRAARGSPRRRPGAAASAPPKFLPAPPRPGLLLSHGRGGRASPSSLPLPLPPLGGRGAARPPRRPAPRSLGDQGEEGGREGRKEGAACAARAVTWGGPARAPPPPRPRAAAA